MLLLDLNDGLLKQAKVHFQKIVDVRYIVNRSSYRVYSTKQIEYSRGLAAKT